MYLPFDTQVAVWKLSTEDAAEALRSQFDKMFDCFDMTTMQYLGLPLSSAAKAFNLNIELTLKHRPVHGVVEVSFGLMSGYKSDTEFLNSLFNLCDQEKIAEYLTCKETGVEQELPEGCEPKTVSEIVELLESLTEETDEREICFKVKL